MRTLKLLKVMLFSITISSCGSGSGSSGGNGGGATTPAFPEFPELMTASLIVDVNGDGKNDVIIGSQGGGFQSPIVLINNSNGSSFTLSTTAIPK